MSKILTYEDFHMSTQLKSVRFKTCVKEVLKEIDRKYHTPTYTQLKSLIRDEKYRSQPPQHRVENYVRELVQSYVKKDKVDIKCELDGEDVIDLVDKIERNNTINLACEVYVKQIIDRLKERD